MPRIGLKLDYDFSQNATYRELYGDRDILDFLDKTGIRALETPVGPETVRNLLWEHMRRCVKAGFVMSCHPYTEMGPVNPAHFSPEKENPCRVFHEAMLRLANETARLQNSETVVNIHPATEHIKINRNELLEKSIAFFKWAHDWCQANAPLVKPVAELQIRPNADEDIQRLGDRYSELLEIAKQSGSGICWDFGHAYMNTQRFGDSLFPPHELIKHITHVHCHDVSDEDHQPLIYGKVPWKEFLAVLLKAGFKETIILEVPAENFTSHSGLNSLIDSVQKLKLHL